MKYRSGLERAQINTLDVVWNLTLAANLISANVQYGQIEAIKEVEGVSEVVLETRYSPEVYSVGGDTADPNTLSASKMIGSTKVWDTGYTGAGTRVAIVDSGLDDDHQSFSSEAYNYALKQNAEKAGLSYNSYVSSLDLLDGSEISSVITKLNAYKRDNTLTAAKLWRNDKVVFGYNYIDKDLDITHDNDKGTGHGSHVAGIAAANRYIETSEGTRSSLLKKRRKCTV
ncbi:Subtilase family protein [compost metagenome]